MTLLPPDRRALPPSSAQLEEARTMFRLEPELTFVRFVANHVFRGRCAGQVVYLRLTPIARRTRAEIHAELEWMQFLSGKGMGVAGVRNAVSGEPIVELDGESCFLAVVFDAVPGTSMRGAELYPQEFVREWGRFIGSMHRLTGSFEPSSAPRKSWDQDDALLAALRSYEPADQEGYDALGSCLGWLRQLPQGGPEFGLVHCDLHPGNFAVEGGKMTAFDFDDACYHWLGYDFATAYNDVLSHLAEKGRTSEAEAYLAAMRAGYVSGRGEAPAWLSSPGMLDRFVLFRSALVYHWLKTGLREGVFADRTAVERHKLLEESRQWMVQRHAIVQSFINCPT